MKAKKIIVDWIDSDGSLSIYPIMVKTKLTEGELQVKINELCEEYKDDFDVWEVLEARGFVKILPCDFDVYSLYI